MWPRKLITLPEWVWTHLDKKLIALRSRESSPWSSADSLSSSSVSRHIIYSESSLAFSKVTLSPIENSFLYIFKEESQHYVSWCIVLLFVARRPYHVLGPIPVLASSSARCQRWWLDGNDIDAKSPWDRFESLIVRKTSRKWNFSRPKTNNSQITHTSWGKSRVTCILIFPTHVSF